MSELTGLEGGARAWLRATDGVLSGLNHALTNGLFPLRAIPMLLAPGDPLDAELHADVTQQVSRLEELLRLYRLMRFPVFESEEPAQVADVVSDALALLRYHSDGLDVSCTVDADPGTPPVLVHPAALTQAVLLLLHAVALCAEPVAGRRTIRFRHRGRDEWVELIAETVGPTIASAGDGDDLLAVRTVLGAAVGTVIEEPLPGGAVRLTAQLATLALMRARERAR